MLAKMRISALAVTVFCLAGCFVFDNPVENSAGSTVTFQVVVTSVSYGGTYVWSPSDNAYKAIRGGTPFYVYLDSVTGNWCLAYSIGNPNASTSYPSFGALPRTSGLYWSPPGEISSVDDSAGGISAQGNPPDSQISQTQVLRVAFQVSPAGNSASYQWVSSNAQTGTAQNILGTGSTYALKPGDVHTWIRAVVTPTDSSGNSIGSPVTSPPVYVFS